MIKKLQKLKAKKGFTLVELIVVIAIIGVLAAILVPTMLGYVENSRITSADQIAKTIKDAAQVAATEMDTQGMGLNATVLEVKGAYDAADGAAGTKVTFAAAGAVGGADANPNGVIGVDNTNYKGNNKTGASGKHATKLGTSLETLLTEQTKDLSFIIIYKNGTVAQVYVSEDATLTTAAAIKTSMSAAGGKAGKLSTGEIVGSNPKIEDVSTMTIN